MFRLLCLIWCIYFTCWFSTVHSAGNVIFKSPTKVTVNEILFRNRGQGTTKAQQMCNKYTLRACNGTLFAPTSTTTSKPTTSTRTTSRSTKGSPLLTTNAFQLMPGEENFSVHVTVVGGKLSAPKEYPHMALIGYGEYPDNIRWSCGASLISEEFVLTAGHCALVNGDPPTYVRLGELDLESVIDEADSKDFPIIQTLVHPEYNPPLLYNDIALMKFQGLDSFSSFIRPICLNILDNFNVQKVTAVGWGATGYGEQGSPQLQDVELDMQDPNRCDQVYRGERLPQGFNTKTMICAGYTPGGKDTCQGDSGGPLQYLKNNTGCDRSYVQVGVVSFGEGCAFPDTPAIYTRVSHFIPWIERIVWK